MSNPLKSVEPQGRPRLLNDTKKAEIAAMISVGCSQATACRYVGCVPQTLRNELRRDPSFREQVVKAERRKELVLLQQIQEAGKKSWRAAAWLLERVNPQEFKLRDPDVVTRAEMQAYIQGVVDEICEELPPDRRERLLGRLTAKEVGHLREQIETLIGDDPTLANEVAEDWGSN